MSFSPWDSLHPLCLCPSKLKDLCALPQLTIQEISDPPLENLADMRYNATKLWHPDQFW